MHKHMQLLLLWFIKLLRGQVKVLLCWSKHKLAPKVSQSRTDTDITINLHQNQKFPNRELTWIFKEM